VQSVFFGVGSLGHCLGVSEKAFERKRILGEGSVNGSRTVHTRESARIYGRFFHVRAAGRELLRLGGADRPTKIRGFDTYGLALGALTGHAR
jgi:hypothetical protein